MKKSQFILSYVLMLATSIMFMSCQSSSEKNSKRPKYVFYFIGDGMGHNIVHATELAKGMKAGLQYESLGVNFSLFPVIGIVNTPSADSYITDSAAAGTALSTGSKTNNGYIGVDANQKELTSIAEKLKTQKNYGVGIITTVSIDHATPAAFYAHENSRHNYYEISMDGAVSNMDVLGGSGFKDAREDVYPAYESNGYTILRGKSELAKASDLDTKLLITERPEANQSSLAYGIDQTENDLSLADILLTTIDHLYKKYADKGFFVMAESGMVDWSGHDNDFSGAVSEVIELEKAVAVALEFYKRYPEETLIIVTADHETGGFTNGRKDTGKKLNYIDKYGVDFPSVGKLTKIISDAKEKNLNFDNIPILADMELNDKVREELKKKYNKGDIKEVAQAINNNVNKSVGAGWTSFDHTGSPVLIYAIGSCATTFAGQMDNTDIPTRLDVLMFGL